jgi:ATP-dependent helicase/nuclease subunit A
VLLIGHVLVGFLAIDLTIWEVHKKSSKSSFEYHVKLINQIYDIYQIDIIIGFFHFFEIKASPAQSRKTGIIKNKMNIYQAVAPENNVVVHAAAGTGKTWLLTSRIIRLLLSGAPCGSILAVTFTRRAAGEMRQRVLEHLWKLVQSGDAELIQNLRELGAPTDAATRRRARGLYENLLGATYELRATTFHAFCQEILRRFPLEADAPPAFELLEATGEYETAAWKALDREITRDREGLLAQALDTLLHELGGADPARLALMDFLAHRSDWWAYTENQAEPVKFACEQLQPILSGANPRDPLRYLAEEDFRRVLARYTELIGRHPTATFRQYAEKLTLALAPETSAETAHDLIASVLLTGEGVPRHVRAGKTLEASLGRDGQEELLELHGVIGARVLEACASQARKRTLAISRAWYLCGQRLLEHFQRLKQEAGLLDFADLEWKTYRLLNRGRHAEWVQYKLDQRINHLLIDEFQDTNPTQWRLLLPLLREMAAGGDRARSVFLVGDEKQSIYRFRRAEPKLFHAAHDWLVHHARARTFTQHISWRSSPAVIHFVNLIFNPGTERDDTEPEGPGEYRLLPFDTHDTHRREHWGRAELLPLVRFRADAGDAVHGRLRDPLREPRRVAEDERHREEGALIAARIRTILGTPVHKQDGLFPLDYGDILILLRDRTYAQDYEEALRRAGIPYAGIGRGTFLEHLEIRDLIHLLKLLLHPYDNLALASVLRSPLFAAAEEDLQRLAAQDEGTWYDRLLSYETGSEPLRRARRLLAHWRQEADRVPVHDLLDRIYSEGDAIARYLSAAPAHLKSRVEGSLNRFLELALEVNHGRYPSLTRFLARLETLTADTGEPEAVTAPQRVRLLTIHGAKGLEAPAVFLADAGRDRAGRDRGPRPLIDWPVAHERPSHFYLIAGRRALDDVSDKLLAAQEARAQREEANLLYVALTRAKQLLYVSGCEPARGSRGWYGFIEKQLRRAEAAGTAERVGLRLGHVRDSAGGEIINTHAVLEHGSPPPTPARAARSTAAVTLDPRLTKPLDLVQPADTVRPSRRPLPGATRTGGAASSAEREIAAWRGVAIHRMLERLNDPVGTDRKSLETELRAEFHGTLPEALFQTCWQEACAVMDHPAFRDYFDPARFREARNEAAILYRDGAREVYGFIDRLVIGEDEVILLEYKTHSDAARENLAELTRAHAEQLRLYSTGVHRLWPEKRLRPLLLFTACRETVEVSWP